MPHIGAGIHAAAHSPTQGAHDFATARLGRGAPEGLPAGTTVKPTYTDKVGATLLDHAKTVDPNSGEGKRLGKALDITRAATEKGGTLGIKDAAKIVAYTNPKVVAAAAAGAAFLAFEGLFGNKNQNGSNGGY